MQCQGKSNDSRSRLQESEVNESDREILYGNPNDHKGPFNNYVDKMRGGGGRRGSKNVYFCPRSGFKNCPGRGGVKKWQNSVHVVCLVVLDPENSCRRPFLLCHFSTLVNFF